VKNVLPPGVIDAQTFLVLANTIYFKSDWADPFEHGSTRKARFRLADGQLTGIRMMNSSKDYGYMESEDFQMAELSYVAGRLSMVVLLPRTHDGLPALEKRLTADRFAEWSAALKPQKINLSIPRFEMESWLRLDETLQAMGMASAFGPADFTGMTDVQAFIQAVVQGTFVKVNEEGTEAAAASTVAVARASPTLPGFPVFRADHPFIFLIRENESGGILFIGRVMKPGEEKVS
jgi:serpin B